MSIILQPSLDQEYPPLTVGTVAEMAERLYLELTQSGYSLMVEDIEAVFIEATCLYAAWATLNIQLTQDQPVPLDNTLPLDASEWAIMQPLVRTHCDLLQARRMEGARSLGGEGFGLSVGEAEQMYELARENMPKAAFIAPPFSIELT